METVGDIVDKLEEIHEMVDKLMHSDHIIGDDIDRDDLVEILGEYCRVLRHLPVQV